MGNTTEKTDTLPGEVSDLAVRLRALSRAEHSDFSIGDEAADELLRLTGENARLNKIESLATEQRLQMEDVELYLMDVSQPDDEDAPWCDRMKSAIELLVQDCNYAVGQKNKAEAELAALKKRIAAARMETVNRPKSYWGEEASFGIVTALVDAKLIGSPVRLLVEDDDV